LSADADREPARTDANEGWSLVVRHLGLDGSGDCKRQPSMKPAMQSPPIICMSACAASPSAPTKTTHSDGSNCGCRTWRRARPATTSVRHRRSSATSSCCWLAPRLNESALAARVARPVALISLKPCAGPGQSVERAQRRVPICVGCGSGLTRSSRARRGVSRSRPWPLVSWSAVKWAHGRLAPSFAPPSRTHEAWHRFAAIIHTPPIPTTLGFHVHEDDMSSDRAGMRWSLKVGDLAGTALYVHATFFVLLACATAGKG